MLDCHCRKMSYCRITGRARGLPRSNYFPLLPPISPADARRFCRITGKAFGLPTHCYIPVILTATTTRSKCKVTHSSDLSAHHFEPDYDYGKRKHIVLADYRYVCPVLDETNDQQKYLYGILNSKVVQCDQNNFIYSIKEQKCNLVFPARLEAAVRDGDVRDVMFAKTNDSVLLCMNKGNSVSLDLQDYEPTDGNGKNKHLFEGEGPRHDVLLVREAEENNGPDRVKRKKNGLRKTKTLDACNGIAEEEDSHGHSDHQASNQNGHKNGIQNGHENGLLNGHENITENGIDHSNETQPRQNGWSDPENCTIEMIGSDKQFNHRPKPDQLNTINGKTQLAKSKLILNGTEFGESIPNQSEIFKIMQNYSKGTVVNDDTSVSGLSINIGTDEVPRNVMILGCIVNTVDGDVFVAGRTVTAENGSDIFEPGIYVQSSKNGPAFIPGQIIYTEDEGKMNWMGN